jgi:hypothetical protein
MKSDERAETQVETNGSTSVNDPHLSTGDGMHLTMPTAGVEHYGTIAVHEGVGKTEK